MSSVSKSSRFSSKSQIIIDAQDKTIAEQGGQISEMAREMEAMKQMLVKAGLNLSTQFWSRDLNICPYYYSCSTTKAFSLDNYDNDKLPAYAGNLGKAKAW